MKSHIGAQTVRAEHVPLSDVIGAVAAPQNQDVAEALGGEQAQRRALALDDGVGHERCAVDDLVDLGHADATHLQQFLQTQQRSLGRIARRGQALVQRDLVFGAIVEDEIREGAADVETDAPTPGCCVVGLGMLCGECHGAGTGGG